jgi:hypothetical protein
MPAIRFPEPPVGVYKGKNGMLEITEDAVCFVSGDASGPQIYRIPYKDLVEVAVKEATWWRYSTLRVCCWQNRRMRFMKNSWNAEMSMVFNHISKEAFRRVCEFLKACAGIANEARAESE